MNNPLYIIDYSNWKYKFQSVYQFTSPGNTYDTSVLFGMFKSLKTLPYKHIAIVLDGYPLRSMELLPSYKSGRVHQLQSKLQIPQHILLSLCCEYGSKLGKDVHIVCSPCQETDEVIASLVLGRVAPPSDKELLSMLNTKPFEDDPFLKKYHTHVVKTSQFSPIRDVDIIASTDGDFIQLQGYPSVFIDKSTSGHSVSNQVTSKSTASLPPFASLVYKAIYGDSSDAVKSVRYRLPKTKYLPYLKDIDTLDKVTDAYNQCTGKTPPLNPLFQEVVCYKENFLRNWEIVKLKYISEPFEIFFEPITNFSFLIESYGIHI